MKNKTPRRIRTLYSAINYTTIVFEHGNVVLDSRVQKANRIMFNSFIKDITMFTKLPAEITAYYTVYFYDSFDTNTPDELLDFNNYIKGYPIVHRVERSAKFWVVHNENGIPTIQNYLISRGLSDTDFLAVNRKLYGVFPTNIESMPLELWNFFEKKHR